MSELGVNRRVTALFKGMSSDFLLREQFVTDPAQVLAEFVGGKSLHDDVAAGANHLLFAMLSNPRLLAWIHEFAEQTKGLPPSGEEFARALSRALAADGDELTMLALISGTSTSHDLFAAQSDLLRAFITVLGSGRGKVASGTDFSPGPSPGTDVSGTHITPGHVVEGGGVFSGPGEVASGTDFSPGPSPGTDVSGTHITPGHVVEGGGVFSGPGEVASGTDFSPGPSPGTDVSGTHITPGHVVEGGGVFSGPGEVASGTDFSPGPSPGTDVSGTHITPGHVVEGGGVFSNPGVVDAQVTLQAVVSFAQQLRRSGTLDTIRFG